MLAFPQLWEGSPCRLRPPRSRRSALTAVALVEDGPLRLSRPAPVDRAPGERLCELIEVPVQPAEHRGAGPALGIGWRPWRRLLSARGLLLNSSTHLSLSSAKLPAADAEGLAVPFEQPRRIDSVIVARSSAPLRRGLGRSQRSTSSPPLRRSSPAAASHVLSCLGIGGERSPDALDRRLSRRWKRSTEKSPRSTVPSAEPAWLRVVGVIAAPFRPGVVRGVEAGPETAVWLQPLVDLGERLGADAVDTALGGASLRTETSPASRSTRRCLETPGWSRFSRLTSSAIGRLRSSSRSRIRPGWAPCPRKWSPLTSRQVYQ